MNFNCITPAHQSAYKQDHSCETALLRIVNDILWGMEKKEITFMICLDLSVAFDTVDHSILLQTLANLFGVSDVALHWYLRGTSKYALAWNTQIKRN